MWPLIMLEQARGAARLISICIAIVFFVRKALQPPTDAADMAAFLVQVATAGTDMHRRAKGADARRQGCEKAGIDTFQPGVAQGAAAERIEGALVHKWSIQADRPGKVMRVGWLQARRDEIGLRRHVIRLITAAPRRMPRRQRRWRHLHRQIAAIAQPGIIHRPVLDPVASLGHLVAVRLIGFVRHGSSGIGGPSPYPKPYSSVTPALADFCINAPLMRSTVAGTALGKADSHFSRRFGITEHQDCCSSDNSG